MAINQPRQYLICYDIADPRRLARVHRFLTTRALALQYSVFSAVLRRRELEDILENLEERIDVRKDDVRVYPLPDAPQATTIGRFFLPEGITLIARGKDLMIAGQPVAGERPKD